MIHKQLTPRPELVELRDISNQQPADQGRQRRVSFFDKLTLTLVGYYHFGLGRNCSPDFAVSGTFSHMSIACQVALLWAGWRGILLRQGIDPGDGPHRDSLVLGKASLTHLDMHRTLMSHVISSLTPHSKRQCFGRDTMHVRECSED